MSDKKQKEALKHLNTLMSDLDQKVDSLGSVFDIVSDLIESAPTPKETRNYNCLNINLRRTAESYQTFASSFPCLFKAKLASPAFAGHWAIGDIVHDKKGCTSLFREGQIYDVIPETACAFTGLYDTTPYDELTNKQQGICKAFYGKDFNEELYKGIPVFEGDILYITDNESDEDAVKPVFTNYGYAALFDGGVCLLNNSESEISAPVFNEIIDARFYGSIFNPEDIAACELYFNTKWRY